MWQTAWKPFDGGPEEVRVQIRQCYDGSLQQRHIWRLNGLVTVNGWIACASRRLDLMTVNMERCAIQPPSYEDLLMALAKISAGDNDPRAVAGAILEQHLQADQQ